MQVAVRRKDDGTWQACVRRRDGTIASVTCREEDIARDIARRVAARMPAGADASGLWSGIKKMAKKIAKARVLKKVAQAYKAVVTNPIVSKAVGIGVFAYTGIPPQVTEAALKFTATGKLDLGTLAAGYATGNMGTLGTAAKIAASPEAKKALAGTVKAAMKGNPRAKLAAAQTMDMLKRVRVLRAAGRLLEERAAAGDVQAREILRFAAGQVAAHVKANGTPMAATAGADWKNWVPQHGAASWTTPSGTHGEVKFELGARRSRVSIVQRAPRLG